MADREEEKKQQERFEREERERKEREAGLEHFKDAINKDNTFAYAYAYAGITCYYLDFFKAEKKHTDELGNYADKAGLS